MLSDENKYHTYRSYRDIHVHYYLIQKLRSLSDHLIRLDKNDALSKRHQKHLYWIFEFKAFNDLKAKLVSKLQNTDCFSE